MKVDRATELATQNGWVMTWDQTFKVYFLENKKLRAESDWITAAQLAAISEEDFLATRVPVIGG